VIAQYHTQPELSSSRVRAVFWALELERVSVHLGQGLFDIYGRVEQTGVFCLCCGSVLTLDSLNQLSSHSASEPWSVTEIAYSLGKDGEAVSITASATVERSAGRWSPCMPLA
jgi:hypothetical protein